MGTNENDPGELVCKKCLGVDILTAIEWVVLLGFFVCVIVSYLWIVFFTRNLIYEPKGFHK